MEKLSAARRRAPRRGHGPEPRRTRATREASVPARALAVKAKNVARRARDPARARPRTRRRRRERDGSSASGRTDTADVHELVPRDVRVVLSRGSSWAARTVRAVFVSRPVHVYSTAAGCTVSSGSGSGSGAASRVVKARIRSSAPGATSWRRSPYQSSPTTDRRARTRRVIVITSTRSRQRESDERRARDRTEPAGTRAPS
eukprot:31433-Pelagococcus_subviridis.AAC.4